MMVLWNRIDILWTQLTLNFYIDLFTNSSRLMLLSLRFTLLILYSQLFFQIFPIISVSFLSLWLILIFASLDAHVIFYFQSMNGLKCVLTLLCLFSLAIVHSIKGIALMITLHVVFVSLVIFFRAHLLLCSSSSRCYFLSLHYCWTFLSWHLSCFLFLGGFPISQTRDMGLLFYLIILPFNPFMSTCY